MEQYRPPPDWRSRDERELERLYASDDHEAARAALGELRRRHDVFLSRQALRLAFGDHDLAQEGLADMDLKLWQKRLHFDPDYAQPSGQDTPSRWRSWAGKLLRNSNLDRLRRRGVEWGSAPPGQGTADPTLPPGRQRRHREAEPEAGLSSLADREVPTAEQEAMQAERKAAVLDCLERLKREATPYFDVLVLYYWEGHKQQWIADVLGVAVSTVCKRLVAASDALRNCLILNHPEVADER